MKQLAFFVSLDEFNIWAKLRVANTRENTTKNRKQLHITEKVEISLKLVKIRLDLGFDLRPKIMTLMPNH